ncbi:MAG: DUF1192 domain-containing protein [Rickettsiales bacterium]|nr:DUF1192 domain-containing protein [Rickettsiales bacterium]MEC7835291.1 DUF1192 domain-containing protein [Pseudomonadota bacterium]MEC8876596.1 DUF1192 domain-containing protein [Pseudomonadota bacterium]MEE3206716.1 DUF1192 domain-containing protein [Pseudomonadota bacterium]|tara:strand:- start:1132 stop:1320 length:189 start_codon:yes stop_codon:yes gene_type:complete
MDEEELSLVTSKSKEIDLENLSIEELKEHIQDLKSEIERIQEMILRKQQSIKSAKNTFGNDD